MTKHRHKAGGDEVSDALRRDIGEIALCLKMSRMSDEDVHAARKRMKNARAKLRLLRFAIGRGAYARENAALRDAARPFGAVRDSRVMLDTVDALLRRKGAGARRARLVALRARLAQAHLEERDDFEASKRIASSAARLERASQRVQRWAVTRDAATLVRGIERIYRSARKALKAAERRCSAEDLHELRKQIKYLRGALEPFEASRKRAVKKIAKRADAVASALGDDHDLFVLQEYVTTQSGDSDGDLIAEIEKRREKLEQRALKRARKLLRMKPRAFARHLRKGGPRRET